MSGKTLASILFDFNAAKQQAGRLSELADELDSLSKGELEGSIGDLLSGWRGSNSQKFAAKARQLQSEIRANAADLRSAAESIRTKAQQIYEAEKRAIEIIAARESGQTGKGGGEGSFGGGSGGSR